MILYKWRVRVYARDKTLLGTFDAPDLQWSHGKGLDDSSLSFTAYSTETDWSATVFDDALGCVELSTDGVTWTPVATTYALTTSGDVLSDDATATQVTGRGVLSVFPSEWPLLHGGGVVNRRGPDVMVFGWQHPDFVDSGWAAATHLTRSSFTITQAKYGEPQGWEDPSAEWIHDPAGTGGLSLMIPDNRATFTVTTRAKYRFVSSADEEHKVYLWGPGWGGVIIDSSEQENGYTVRNVFEEILEPGDYYVTAEMTTVNTPGGDGTDCLSLYVCTVDQKNKLASVVFRTDVDWLVLRQPKDNPRPGLTYGYLLAAVLYPLGTWAPTCSYWTLITDTFSNTTDSGGVTWGSAPEMSWPAMTPLSQVFADLSEHIDFDMGPIVAGAIQNYAWQTKGTDLSATVALVPGSAAGAANENVVSYTWQAGVKTATQVVGKTEDGFFEVLDSGIDDGSARTVYLESEQSTSIGQAIAQANAYIAENGVITDTYSATIIPVTGCVPGVDFSWGDTISGLDRNGAAVDVQVISWSGKAVGGHLEFDLEMV